MPNEELLNGGHKTTRTVPVSFRKTELETAAGEELPHVDQGPIAFLRKRLLAVFDLELREQKALIEDLRQKAHSEINPVYKQELAIRYLNALVELIDLYLERADQEYADAIQTDLEHNGVYVYRDEMTDKLRWRVRKPIEERE